MSTTTTEAPKPTDEDSTDDREPLTHDEAARIAERAPYASRSWWSA